MARTRSKVGRNIRKLREARGWSGAELARRVRLTRGGVWAIEVGNVKPPLATMERFANALGVSLSEIIPMGPQRAA